MPATAADKADTERVIRILIAILYSVKNHLRAEWGAVLRPRENLSSESNGDGPKATTSGYSELLPKGLEVFEEYGLGLPLELTFFVETYIDKGYDKGWFHAPQASQMQVQLNLLVDAYGRMETIKLIPLPVAHLYDISSLLISFMKMLM